MTSRTRIAHLARSAGARYRCGDYQGAAADFREALKQLAAITPLDVISLLNGLGVVCKYLGAFDEAADWDRRALAIARRVLEAADPWFATLYHNLGGLEHARGRHA